MAALRVSCVIHGLVLLLALGCAAHRPVIPLLVPDPELTGARAFVEGVAGNMPLWDADAISRYERVEIARVKADVAMARQQDGQDSFLACVTKLHDDWNALIALDERLKRESLT
jgi:hypothetical protein